MKKDHRKDWWKKSRKILNRLFEGYCKDYGTEAGAKIVRAIIEVLGGCRITIPASLSSNPDNAEALLSLYACLCERFQKASGEAVMRKLIMELKGCRISFPSLNVLYREERNRKVRAMFNGRNCSELAIIFGLSRSQVSVIVNSDLDDLKNMRQKKTEVC